MMRLSLKTPPAQDFIDDARLFDHLRLPVSGSPPIPDDYELVSAIKGAAMSMIDGPKGIGRSMITQTWTMTLGGFPVVSSVTPFSEVLLPLPPIQSVTSVKYYDADGVLQTFDALNYKVVPGDDDAIIYPGYGIAWPETQARPDAVQIEFVSGYGDDPSDVPRAIVSAALLVCGDLYEHREAQIVDCKLNKNNTVDWLLAPFRKDWPVC